VLDVCALGLDLDHVPPDALAGATAGLSDRRLILHATHSDRPEDRCLRVVVALSRPVPAADWPRFWDAAVALLGVPADPATRDASRLYYLPSRPTGADAAYASADGEPLDVDAVLAVAAPHVLEVPTPSGDGDYGPASPELLARVLARLQRHGPAIEGRGGDKHTFTACAIARHGYALSEEEALAVLTLWDAGNVPPWGREGLREKMRNAEAYASGERGAERAEAAADAAMASWADALAGGAPAPAVHAGTPSVVDDVIAAVEPEPGSWEAVLLEAGRDVKARLSAVETSTAIVPLFEPARGIMLREYPPTPWLVRGLITGGGVGALATEPKSAKTWLATELAIAVATGTPACGQFHVEAPAQVAYFYLEDQGPSIRNRLRALCAARGLDPLEALGRLHCQPRGRSLDLTRPLDVAVLVASCRMIARGGMPVKLLVIDPLRDAHSAEEDTSDGMAPVMRALRIVGDLVGCAVLFVHHAGKLSGDQSKRRLGQRMRGSSAIHGAVDFGIYLADLQTNGKDEFSNSVESEVKGARGAGYFALKLAITDNAFDEAIRAEWTYSTESLAKQKTTDAVACAEAAVVEHLTAMFSATTTELRVLIGGKTATAKAIVDAMIKRGDLVQSMDRAGKSYKYQLRAGFGGAGIAPTRDGS
jgi:RecA-family ATPase